MFRQEFGGLHPLAAKRLSVKAWCQMIDARHFERPLSKCFYTIYWKTVAGLVVDNRLKKNFLPLKDGNRFSTAAEFMKRAPFALTEFIGSSRALHLANEIQKWAQKLNSIDCATIH